MPKLRTVICTGQWESHVYVSIVQDGEDFDATIEKVKRVHEDMHREEEDLAQFRYTCFENKESAEEGVYFITSNY